MKNKGYHANVTFEDEDSLFVGTVATTRDTITFEAPTVEELCAEFKTGIDTYLEYCAEYNREPDKSP